MRRKERKNEQTFNFDYKELIAETEATGKTVSTLIRGKEARCPFAGHFYPENKFTLIPGNKL